MKRKKKLKNHLNLSSTNTNRDINTNREEPLIPIWVLLVMFLLVLAVYYPVFTHQFTNYDDDVNVYQNSFYPLSLETLSQIWTTSFMSFYIPLTYTLWGVQYFLAELISGSNSGASLSPFIFHAVNFFLHLACGCFVFLLLRDLLKLYLGKEETKAALVGTLFFLLHPLQAEVVPWVTGFKDMLSGFFSILTIYFYTKFLMKQEQKTYVFAMIAFLFALLSKPSAICVISLYFIIDRAFFSRPWRQSFLDLISPLMIALPLLIITQMSRGAGAAAVSQGTDFISRILVALHAMGFYIAKVFWPMDLIHYYGLDPKTVLATKAYLPYSAIFFAFIIFLLLFKQHRKVLLGSTLVFFICLFPYLGFIAYDGQQQSTVSNRYVYFAMIGFSFAIAYLFVFLQNSRYSQLKYLAVIPLLAMCILSESQCRYWENTKTLCEHTISLDPHNKQAYFSLAIDAEAKKDKLKAIHYYELGMKMVPESEKSSRKRIAELRYEEDLISGAKLAAQGDYEAASRLFEKVLSSEPENYTALVNLGNIAAINRDLASAISFFARAIESEPAIVTAYLNIGKAYIFKREAKLAREAFRKVLEIEPNNANAQEQLHHLSMIQE